MRKIDFSRLKMMSLILKKKKTLVRTLCPTTAEISWDTNRLIFVYRLSQKSFASHFRLRCGGPVRPLARASEKKTLSSTCGQVYFVYFSSL